MVQQVNIQGVGVVDFPDNMSQEEITNAIENDILKNAVPSQPVIEEPIFKGQEPQPLPADDTSSDFIRGIKSYIPQQKELFGGAQVLTGKAFGSADMIKSGLDRMERAQKEQIPLSKETDSFTAAFEKGLGAVITDYIPYIAGQGVGMVSEAVLSGVVGSILGSVAGPGGTVSGGVSGVVAKNLIKKGVKEQTEKIAKEFGQEAADNYVKKEIGDQLADSAINNQLRKEVNKEIGRKLGYTQLAARYGAGETTTRAVDEAIAGIDNPEEQLKKIQELSTSKLAAISTAHALADYVGIKIGLGALEGLAPTTRSMLLNVARKIGITGLQEAPVEVVQSALERYGADLPLADKQAMREYVDAAAGGFFMPIIPATIGGIRTPKPITEVSEQETKEILDTEIEDKQPESYKESKEEKDSKKKIIEEEKTASETADDIIKSEETITAPVSTQQEDIQRQQELFDSQQQIVQQEQEVEAEQLDMFPPQMDLFEGEEDAGIDGRTNLRSDEIPGQPTTSDTQEPGTLERPAVASSGSSFDTASGRTITNNTTLKRNDVLNFTDEELRKSAKLFVNNPDNLSIIAREQAKRRNVKEKQKIDSVDRNQKIDSLLNNIPSKREPTDAELAEYEERRKDSPNYTLEQYIAEQDFLKAQKDNPGLTFGKFLQDYSSPTPPVITRRTEYDQYGNPIEFESTDPEANLKVTDNAIIKTTPNSVFDSNLKPKVTKYQTDNNLQESHIIKENVDTEGNVESFSLVPRDTLDNTSVESVAKYFARNYINTKEAWNKREDAKPKPSEVRSFLEKNLSKEQFQEINKRKEYSTIADAAYKLMYKKTSGIAGIREERVRREKQYDNIAQEQGGMQPMNALMTETFEKTGAIEEDVPAPYERSSDFAEQRAEAIKDWAFEAANDEYGLKDKNAIDKQIQKLAKERGYEEGEFSINDPLDFIDQEEYNNLVNEAPNVKDKTTLDKFNDKKKVRDAFEKTFNAREKAVADRMKNTYAGMARILNKSGNATKVIGQKTLNERKERAQLKRIEKEQEAAKQRKRGAGMNYTRPLTPAQLQALENKNTTDANNDVMEAIKSGKSIAEILKVIAGKASAKLNSTQTVANMLAKVISKIPGYNTKIKLGVVRGDRFAHFDPRTNTIVINKKIEFSAPSGRVESLGRIVVHEVMHSMMDHIIDNRSVLPLSLQKELDTLEKQYEYVSQTLNPVTLELFGIDSFKEFVAEMFSSEEVQKLVGTLGRSKKERESKIFKETYGVGKVSGFLKDMANFILKTIRTLGGFTPGITAATTLQSIENIITSKEYVPASETLQGKGISFAPKKAKDIGDSTPQKIRETNRAAAKDYEYRSWFGNAFNTFKDLFASGEKSMTNLIRRFQNDRIILKKIQDVASNAGILTRSGKYFNNIYDQVTLALGRADKILRETVKRPIDDFTEAFSSYLKYTKQNERDAVGDLQSWLTAFHEAERRLVKFLRFVPLSTKDNITLSSGRQTSAAQLRRDIFKILTTNRNLTKQQIKKYRDLLQSLADNYADTNGQSFRAEDRYKSIDMNDIEYSVVGKGKGEGPLTVTERDALIEEYNNLPEEQKAIIDKIRKAMKVIQEQTKELNFEANYMPVQAKNMIEFYGWENYIPLKGKTEIKGENEEFLDIQGKRLSGDLRRMESTFEKGAEQAQDPFAQVLVDATVAGARAGRKGLTQSIKNAINTDVSYIDKKGNKVNKRLIDGEIKTYSFDERFLDEIKEDMNDKKKILHFNEDGSVDVIKLKDEAVLEAVRRTYRDSHPLLDLANGVTGLLGQLHTRFNPAFPVLNFVRDALTNAYVIAAEIGPRSSFDYLTLVAEQVVKGGMKDTATIANLYNKNGIDGIRRYAKEQARKGNTYPQSVIEYLDEGGNIAYVQGLSVAGTMHTLSSKLNKNKILQSTEGITKFFDSVMLTFELASRVAGYRVYKQDFITENKNKITNKAQLEKAAREAAAAYAKNFANFEQTGEYGRALGAWFMFFRPAATGAVRALEGIGPGLRRWQNVEAQLPDYVKNDPQKLAQTKANFEKRQKASRAVIFSSVGMGLTVYYLAAALSGDDDDNNNKTFGDDMRRWTRYARFAIPGTDIVLQIPWGFGNGGLAAFGAQIAGLASGKENPPREVIGNMIEILMDSYLPLPISRINPLESPGHATAFLTDSFVPSVARPLFEYAMNMNAFGQQIYNSRRSRVGDAYTGGDNIPDMYKDGAILLSEMTDGALSWSPNTMYFFANNLADGWTRIMQNTYGLGLTLAGQKDFDPKRDLQIFDSFLSKYSKADQRAYGRVRSIVETKQRRLDANKNNPEVYQRYVNNNPLDPIIVETFNTIEAKKINPARNEVNKIRRMPNLTPKERNDLLEPRKEVLDAYTKGLTAEIEVMLEIAEK